MLAGCYASSCFCTPSRSFTPSPPAQAPPRAAPWASRRRPTACSTSSGAMTAVLRRAVWGSLGCMVLAALDAVMRRARAAPLLVLLSLAEGRRKRREETCTRACMSAARLRATHVPHHRGWVERRSASWQVLAICMFTST
jgi:hypothetical protein